MQEVAGAGAARRRQMIAEAAYYLAERRGFEPGGAERDWLAAERTIDALLAGARVDPGELPHGLRLLAGRKT
ncbi:DUF2934 domain-containing protein [Marichromatium gracile]|uniref:DUF2934 domain-containing protein n=1 Tax=Marichromatium gracile TaxID=1048 RepID=UPI0009EED541|nr:DUF2934 domain-containing protein [Marichromatium gracile]